MLDKKSLERCIGTLPRRGFLKIGFSGLGGLSLPALWQHEAMARELEQRPRGNEKSIIVLWLWGGPSHMETFDLKPEAPLEYRGEFRPVPTAAPGLSISEHLPRLASH